jgi:hypothetical protein
MKYIDSKLNHVFTRAVRGNHRVFLFLKKQFVVF